jgi:hypothetical protein
MTCLAKGGRGGLPLQGETFLLRVAGMHANDDTPDVTNVTKPALNEMSSRTGDQ